MVVVATYRESTFWYIDVLEQHIFQKCTPNYMEIYEPEVCGNVCKKAARKKIRLQNTGGWIYSTPQPLGNPRVNLSNLWVIS